MKIIFLSHESLATLILSLTLIASCDKIEEFTASYEEILSQTLEQSNLISKCSMGSYSYPPSFNMQTTIAIQGVQNEYCLVERTMTIEISNLNNDDRNIEHSFSFFDAEVDVGSTGIPIQPITAICRYDQESRLLMAEVYASRENLEQVRSQMEQMVNILKEGCVVPDPLPAGWSRRSE